MNRIGGKPGNMVLCGFMGCGKTTLGKLLAERTGLEFVDVDDEVVRMAGMPVTQIFAEQGEPGFRDLEHRAVLELAGGKGLVIATGGGAMAFPRNVEPLRNSGLVVYLNPGFAECYRRIRSSDRPLVKANTRAGMEELYRGRDGLYRAASHRELSLSGPPEAWAEALAELWKEAVSTENGGTAD